MRRGDPAPGTVRVRDLRDGRERDVPVRALCAPPFMLDVVARALAHGGGFATLEDAEARALGPVPLATFEAGDEVFVEDAPGAPWPLVTVVAPAVTEWRLLPCGASVLMAGDTPLRVTDGAMESMVEGGGEAGVDPAVILAELEALTGVALRLGPFGRRDDELEASAAVCRAEPFTSP
ncbi:MAG: hypothetical protein R3A48_21670 [Polyangiales bacterium]